MIGVSVEPVAANRAFQEKRRFPFTILADEDRSMSLAFGAVGRVTDQYSQRYTYVIDESGVIEQAIATKNPGGQAAALLDQVQT